MNPNAMPPPRAMAAALRTHWASLAPREQTLVLAAATVLGLALLWWLLLAPASLGGLALGATGLAIKMITVQCVFANTMLILLRRRIPELARRVGVTPDAITDALVEISELDPSPGRKFSEDSNRVVVPDVKVYKDEVGEWVIVLNTE